MSWKIEIDPAAERELDKLDPQIAKRIIKFLHERIAPLEDPRSIGDPLKGPQFGEFWRYQALQQAIAHHKAGQLQDAKRLYRAPLQAPFPPLTYNQLLITMRPCSRYQ